VFPSNNSQPISHPSNSFQRPAFQGLPNALIPPPHPVAQIQPPPGYTDIDKIERRLNNHMERMVNANMEKMMGIITEQFFQLASSSRKPGTFPSQPKVNPKSLVSPCSSGPSSSENVRKINPIISLRSSRKIDNQVGNSKEPCKFPHNFFQNSSPTSPVMDSEDTIDGVPVDSSKDFPSNSSSNQEKLQENDSSDLSSPKNSSSPSTVEKVQKPTTLYLLSLIG